MRIRRQPGTFVDEPLTAIAYNDWSFPRNRLVIMALLGPMVVVAESSAADLVDVLAKAGAFPISEARWGDVPAVVNEIQPVALAIADPRGNPSPPHLRAAIHCIEARGGPIMPVVALVEEDTLSLIHI